MMSYKNTQSGNALWFILIAIVLLGLLTSMLTRSGGSTNDTGDFEQRAIEAREFLEYLQSIELALLELQARGCSENDFNFHNDNDNDGDYYDNEGCCTASGGNANSPPEEKCHVFAPGGTGLPYIRAIDKGWSTATWPYPYGKWFFSSWNRAPLNDSSGSQYRGIIAGLSDVKQSLCLGVNEAMGIENPNGQPPISDGEFFGGGHFQGTFGGFGPAIFSTSGGEIDQKKAGCFQHDTGGGVFRNAFYYVIYMRPQ